jgi:hypothetical protein
MTKYQNWKRPNEHSMLQIPININPLYTDSLTAKLLLALASTVILGSESHGTHGPKFIIWRLWEPSVDHSDSYSYRQNSF